MSGDDTQAQPSGQVAGFLLFVAAASPSALRAMHNLEHCLDANGIARDGVEIVDVFRDPGQALTWRVFATPALIRRAAPEKRLYGDLSEADVLARFLLQGT